GKQTHSSNRRPNDTRSAQLTTSAAPSSRPTPSGRSGRAATRPAGPSRRRPTGRTSPSRAAHLAPSAGLLAGGRGAATGAGRPTRFVSDLSPSSPYFAVAPHRKAPR